jgi:hypothetical protein
MHELTRGILFENAWDIRGIFVGFLRDRKMRMTTITVVTYIYSSRGVFNKIYCFYFHLGFGTSNSNIFLTKDTSGFYACDHIKGNKLFCIFLYSRMYIYTRTFNIYIFIYIIALYLLLLLRFRKILHSSQSFQRE